MSERELTVPECDGALFNENVSRFPAGELAKYAGHHVASQALVPAGPDTFRTAGGLVLRFERSGPGATAVLSAYSCKPEIFFYCAVFSSR